MDDLQGKQTKFFGFYPDYRSQAFKKFSYSAGILLFGFLVSFIVEEFNRELWKLNIPAFQINMLLFAALAILPIVQALRLLRAGIIKVDWTGLQHGKIAYVWTDIQGLFSHYLHVVFHHYHRHEYVGSTNRVYDCLLIRSDRKDIQIAALKKSFSGARSTPDQNEIKPFPNTRYFELRVNSEPHVIILTQKDFLNLQNMLLKQTVHKIEEMKE